MLIFLIVLVMVVRTSSGQLSCGQRTVEQVYQWSVLEYSTPPGYVANPSYRPNETFINGIVDTPNGFILSLPRSLTINPATLAYIPAPTPGAGPNVSPILQPYPDIDWNTLNGNNTDCDRTLVSVHRATKDSCNRLWALDSGVVTSYRSRQISCPPKIVIFDLSTNQLVRVVTIPSYVLTPVSLLLNIKLDNVFTSSGSSNASTSCDDTYAYIADAAAERPGLIVYKSPDNSFKRIFHPSMAPDPRNYNLVVQGEKFHFFQGIQGMDVGGTGQYRRVYYQPAASDYTYYMPTSEAQKEQVPEPSQLKVFTAFKKSSDSSGLMVDETDGCVVYTPISYGTVDTWNPYTQFQRTVYTNPVVIVIIPNYTQMNRTTVYAVSNRGQRYATGRINTSETNIRIIKITLKT